MESKKQKSRKFYRSRSDRFLGGVCGGLGDYFEADPNLFRVLFVVLTIFGGLGIILYITALIIVPENPDTKSISKGTQHDRTLFWAVLFIVIGILLLLKQFGFFHYFYFHHIPWSALWGIFLIVVGIALVFKMNKSKSEGESAGEEGTTVEDSLNRIYRSREDRLLAGVCAGIADYFNIDPSILRLAWVLVSVASGGLGLLIYILLIFVFPLREESDIVK